MAVVHPWPIRSFNPTLVRLRRSSSSRASVSVVKFQSHAGSIEARPSSHCAPSGRSRFQSHAGSIEAGVFQAQPWRIGEVSIPRWFD